jgi:hypothetical protein
MWGDKVKMPSHGVDALRTCWLLKEAADRALLLLRVRASSWALLLCVYQLSTLLQALDDPLVVDCGKQLWSTERVLAALGMTPPYSIILATEKIMSELKIGYIDSVRGVDGCGVGCGGSGGGGAGGSGGSADEGPGRHLPQRLAYPAHGRSGRRLLELDQPAVIAIAYIMLGNPAQRARARCPLLRHARRKHRHRRHCAAAQHPGGKCNCVCCPCSTHNARTVPRSIS